MAPIRRRLSPLFNEREANDKRTKLYYTVNGIKREKRLKPPTEKQMAQRLKLGLASSFAGHLKEIIEIGYATKKKIPVTPGNRAVRQFLNVAIIGEHPDYQIDYPKVEISKGNLNMVFDLRMVISENGKINIRWDDDLDSLNRDSRPDDDVHFFIYNATTGTGHNFKYAAKRLDFKLEMQCHVFEKEDVLHYWLFLASAVHKRYVSGSVYLLK
ncbi:DUF6266 family protein [Pedobacter cryoconitis]|uniref:Uncharacterized protein n=1 Tax=Pedobacter cryoconitis TaxID=188932 RepID=A0A7X0J8H0_9SPHI|nr:DUF6266 family protein [Pedobacter cryoconitis]MBB6503020.1 hypothetical protein [Pedobacter cryoconitis]